MAKLTTKQRDKLKSSDFALPGRRYPIQDIEHGRNALARVAQNGTPAEIAAVKKKVYARYPSLADNEAQEKKDGVKDNEKAETNQKAIHRVFGSTKNYNAMGKLM